MDTPIVDFVKEYIENNRTRFHMPGHKGHVFFGLEPYDITEIKGADVLHHGEGIIAKSEKNASELFARPDIDGALVGGASLKAEDFLAICHCADNL